jgi:hypothetical protein
MGQERKGGKERPGALPIQGLLRTAPLAVTRPMEGLGMGVLELRVLALVGRSRVAPFPFVFPVLVRFEK